MFALQVILIIVIVSGVIAFVGDRVGHAIGRKRLTVFGLRPRHTAIAITIITGSLIAAFTVGIILSTSNDARTAMFGLDKLRRLISENTRELEKIKSDRANLASEIEKLQKTLVDSKKEIADLTKTKASLSKEITTAREGSLLFRVNDVITSTIIETTGDTELMKEKLTKILSDTDSVIKRILKKSKKHYIIMPQAELDEAASFAASRPGSVIVRVVSARNIVFGEDIPVHFELFENLNVFKRGETITSSPISGSKSLPEIEQKIKELLAKVNEIALSKGVIPNPDGSVGVIPYSRIFEVARLIKAKGRSVNVSVEAIKDTTSSGPLQIELTVQSP